MLVIGITGTLGSGKGTVVEHLVKKGFIHFSVRDYLIGKINERCLPVNRDSMVIVANELREKHGPAHVVSEIYNLAMKKQKNCVIESIRTPGEVVYLKEQGNFMLIAVDADPKIRYERIRSRKSQTDDVTFEKFIQDEARETENVEPHKQNLKVCIQMADVVINNNGGLQDLAREVDRIFSERLNQKMV